MASTVPRVTCAPSVPSVYMATSLPISLRQTKYCGMMASRWGRATPSELSDSRGREERVPKNTRDSL